MNAGQKEEERRIVYCKICRSFCRPSTSFNACVRIIAELYQIKGIKVDFINKKLRKAVNGAPILLSLIHI